MNDDKIMSVVELGAKMEWVAGYCDDEEVTVSDVLDLINRQKAEIEELKRELRRAEHYLNQIADDLEDWDD